MVTSGKSKNGLIPPIPELSGHETLYEQLLCQYYNKGATGVPVQHNVMQWFVGYYTKNYALFCAYSYVLNWRICTSTNGLGLGNNTRWLGLGKEQCEVKIRVSTGHQCRSPQ